jgi:predicted enzyme related to lactoylglutathione lyase
MKAPYLSVQWFDLISSATPVDPNGDYFKVAYNIKNSPYGEISYVVAIPYLKKLIPQQSSPRCYLRKISVDLSIPNLTLDYRDAIDVFVGKVEVADAISSGKCKLSGDISSLSQLNDLECDFSEFGSFVRSITEFETIDQTSESSQYFPDQSADLNSADLNSMSDSVEVAKTTLQSSVLGDSKLNPKPESPFLVSTASNDTANIDLSDIESEKNKSMEILSSRILLRPSNLQKSIKFYRDDLGLAIYREFGEGDSYGIVFYLGGGFLEVSGTGSVADPSISIWLQVRDINSAARTLKERNILITKGPTLEPWGLIEMWVSDPDGVRLYFVEVPEDHPLRVRKPD